VLFLERREKNRFKLQGVGRRLSTNEAQPKRTVWGAEALLHPDARLLGWPGVIVLANSLSETLSICRAADVGDVRHAVASRLRLLEGDDVDTRRRRQRGEKGAFAHESERTPCIQAVLL
jgi:hypothetical protein